MLLFKDFVELYPFFSFLFSIILFAGSYQLGELILANEFLKSILINISEIKYQKIIVAINFLMFFLFPIVLFFSQSKYILSAISIIIFILGICKIIKKIKKYSLKNTKLNYFSFEKTSYHILIIGFFFITFNPINQADSLDYHLSAARTILNTGKLPTEIENMHNLLVGSGEVIISLGLFFGAEQFGTMVQFSGLLSLIGIIKKINKDHYFFSLLILTSPVVIFLTSSPKPQLFHICSSAVIFFLIYFYYKYKFDKINRYYFIIFVNIFLINSINAKFSFILSSFIIYCFFFLLAFKKKFLKKMIITSFLIILCFYFNYIYWKYSVWGGEIYEYIYNPFTINVNGSVELKNYLANYRRELSPLYLIIPKDLNVFSDVIGYGPFIFCLFYLIKDQQVRLVYYSVFFFILIIYIFGQPSGRFIFEIYIWLVLILSFYNIKIKKNLKILFYPQFIISLFVIFYGVFFIGYGFVNKDLKDIVMSKTANGYNLFKWSNSIINKEDTVISIHRSVSLGKSNTISTSFLNYVDLDNQKLNEKNIKNILNTNKNTYLLTFGDINNTGIFSNCIDYLYLTKKKVGKIVGRNPFTDGPYYDGYLFKMKNIKTSNCLMKYINQ